jgi:hypothetical protein
MYILSIDVGIKNLAYVVLEVNQVNNTCSVSKWDVISLLSEDGSKNRECMGFNKKGKCKCKSKAQYFKNNMYYCKKHARACSEFHIPCQQTSFKVIKNKKLSAIKEFCESYGIDTELCKFKDSYVYAIKKYIDDNFFEKIVEQNANDADLVSIGRNMNHLFNQLFTGITFDVVCIENQISPIANRMKTIQGMISQYFIMKDCKKIAFISSSNKLKDFIKGKKTTYSERKKMGIDVTRTLLDEYGETGKWLKHFDSHKKKDDLADCYLQGMYYMKHEVL